MCPVDVPIGLKCTVLQQTNGQWKEVASVTAPATLSLGAFDPAGCYNILCESTDTVDSAHIEWKGSFTTAVGKTGFQKSWVVPYYLSGKKDGSGCSSLGTSCPSVDITIQSRRTQDTESADMYKCAEVKIKCKTPPPPPTPRPPTPPPPTPKPPTPSPPTPKPPTPCPPVPVPHIKKCQMKNRELVIEFEDKCAVFDEHLCFKFKSSTKYPLPEWEYSQYCVSQGSYDGGKSSGDGSCSGKFYLPVTEMDAATNDKKKKEAKPFFGYVVTKDGCVSPPFYCENKNLTPLGLDLDGSGHVEMIQGEFSIDLTGDHFPEILDTWFAPTEGILIDVSYELANGINGDHLFGDMGGRYANGFAKLATLDENTDGIISGSELDHLAIWKDMNSNAALDDGELFTLADYGIVSFSVSHSHLLSSATLSDGSVMKVEDLYFTLAELEAVV